MRQLSGIALLAAAAALSGCGGGEAEHADSLERAPDAQERAMLDDAASMLDDSTAAATPPVATAAPDDAR